MIMRLGAAAHKRLPLPLPLAQALCLSGCVNADVCPKHAMADACGKIIYSISQHCLQKQVQGVLLIPSSTLLCFKHVHEIMAADSVRH